MKYYHLFILFLAFNNLNSQSINLNESFIIDDIRINQLLGNIDNSISFNQRPLRIEGNLIDTNPEIFNNEKYSKTIFSFLGEIGSFKILPLDYNIELNTNHPYNRNNGSMIPNRGYQHIVSLGFYTKIGPLDIQFKPEHLFSQNKDFEGFGEGPNGHYPAIWAKRYQLWNTLDIPERFGEKKHNKNLIGQSYIKLNFKGLSFGISNENLWWGPSLRNSIMMSNHARGFSHLTFNTYKPIKTFLGNFEFQLISGRLESSDYTPPNTEMEYAGTKLYQPKINQVGLTGDWRYLQALNLSYSPKWIPGFSVGFVRWVQMYSALVRGKYWWMEGKPTWFPVFKNLFRKNDLYENYEAQTNQAAGLYFRWLWKDSKAEIYAEFHHNDSKQNIRDLLLDSDHSRAATIGLQKIFKVNSDDILFSWEWTQMEQTAGRLLRNAGSWYAHGWTYEGYTNEGEVLGAGIGPGSNSHYFSLKRVRKKNKIGIAFEIIDQDNDFYYDAFSSAQDSRRYWKDFNFHINYSKKFNHFLINSNFMFSRSLNYQWDLQDNATPYYRPGNDVNNFHIAINLVYFFSFKN